MKIIRIKIGSFRGIINFDADLESKTLVITGPNGTGKSGIIDAIDFLLTGDLQRLRGEGTKDLSLENHGRHVDKKLEDVFIEAEIEEKSQIYRVRRELKGKKLKLLDGHKESFANLVLKLEAGQFLLSRRELLKFIACTGQKRSEEIQALLDTSGIEKIRKNLTSAVSAIEKKVSALESTIKINQSTSNVYLGVTSDKDSERRFQINILREKLKQSPINDWKHDTDIVDFSSTNNPTELKSQKKSVFEKQINLILPQNNPIPIYSEGITIKEKISSILNEIATVNHFHKIISGNELIKKGIELLENNTCPLCDTHWESKDLEKHLKEKKKLTEKAIELKDQYESLVGKYTPNLRQLALNYKALISTIETEKAINLSEKINNIVELIENRILMLNDINQALTIKKIIQDESSLIDIKDVDLVITELDSLKNTLPDETEEEKALKTLHQVAALFKSISDSHLQLKIEKYRLVIATSVLNHFLECREKFFGSLFTDIENDFTAYYKFLNQDEDTFTAKIIDNEKTIDLQVGFYDRGLHPPHALHSEGHQDSMGICLFLALMKKLKGDQFTLALFDDVMMSIDIGHRRRLCALLKKEFSNTQFVITTHDPVWARQLKEFEIVRKKNIFHFLNWSLEAGPVFEAKEVWEILRDKARAGLVHEAAAGLRRNLELEFQEICTNLHAKVTFKSSHSWELAELKEAAVSTFNDLLKKAKAASNSWGNKVTLEKLKNISDKLSECIKASKVDEWQINPLIHYNQWGNFTKEEMLPTIDALEKLVLAFSSDANSKYYLTSKAGSHLPTAISSIDGADSFTLIFKDE